MSAILVLRTATDPTSATYNLSGCRWENTGGTPVHAVTFMENGNAIADTYLCTFVGATTVRVVCAPKNPYYDYTGKTVTLGESSHNYELIPGVDVVFHATAATSDTFTITVGQELTAGAVATAYLGMGTLQAGVTTAGQQIICRNIGSDSAEETMIYCLPGLYYTGTNIANTIENIIPCTSPTRHKLAEPGTYVISFSDLQDKTVEYGCYTADVSVNYEGGGANKMIENAHLDGSTYYEYGVTGYDDAHDYFKGLCICFGTSTTLPADVTLEVCCDNEWIELAPDESDAPGNYSINDLSINDGEGLTIQPSHNAKFWIRANPPLAGSIAPMRKFVLLARCLTT